MIYDGANKYNNNVLVLLINTLLNISLILIETIMIIVMHTMIHDGVV